MTEKFEYEGVWWFPEKTDCKTHGKLEYCAERGIELHLQDFKTYEEGKKLVSLIKNVEQQESSLTILGSSFCRKEITLSGCFCKTYTNGFPTVFYVSTVFIGTHFSKKEEEKFHEVAVGFQHLSQWVDISGLRVSFSKSHNISIRYKFPKAVEIFSDRDFNVEVRFGYKNPFDRSKLETSLKEEVYITIKASSAKSLGEFLSIINVFQDFLTLAIAEPIKPNSIQGKTEKAKLTFNDEEYFEPIQIITEKILINKLDSISFIIPPKMLFTLEVISRKKRLMKNWFNKAALLKPIYDLYFGTLYQQGMYTSNEFLNLSQALESYHRRVIKNTEVSKAKHQKRVEVIIKKAPIRHANWLKEKLAFSNEPTLRKRLKDLCKKHSKVLGQFIKDEEGFIKKTVDTRNYYTHFDKAKEQKIVKGKELLILIIQLRLLIQLCLLAEIGFTAEEREHLISALIKEKYSQILPH